MTIWRSTMSSKKNVLVTATGGRSVGAGILHSLLRVNDTVAARWNVIAADADPFSWGLYKAEQAELLPLASSPTYFEALARLIEKHSIDAVIPGSEAEVVLLSGNRTRLPVPVICNSFELMPLMTDKFKTAEKLRGLGLPVI